MSKDIDLSQKSSWSDAEAKFNVKYLEDRGRYKEAREIREARDFGTGPLVQGETFQPDTHQSHTSTTGTNDTPPETPSTPPADSFETSDDDNQGTQTNVPQSGPTKSEEGNDGDGGSEDDEAPEEGSVAWIQKSPSKEVAEWVGDSKERAQYALDAENSSEEESAPRQNLTKALNKVLGQD